MPKRARPRLGKPTKPVKKEPRLDEALGAVTIKEEEEEPPSDAKWKTMTEFTSFVVLDLEGDEYRFDKGAVATILPDKTNPQSQLQLHEYWLGKIREIRANGDDAEVWARVQWYYSPADVGGVIKSFDSSACGKYERIFSDHFDYVSSRAFNEVVKMSKFKENDPEQEPIPDGQFYCRYTFEYKARKLQPKPGENTCKCSKPYNPSHKSEIMHFCPRPSCRRTYHQRCLSSPSNQKQKPNPRPASHRLDLLCSSPDTDDPICLPSLISGVKPQPQPKTWQGRGKKIDTQPTLNAALVNEALSKIPSPLLLRVAQQPILRGASAGGVVGNVMAVTRARRMVYDALQGFPVPEDWEDVLGEGLKIESLLEGESGKKVLPLICPSCLGAI